MISKNIRSNNNQPFLLRPAGKDYLWGGRRLNDDFSKGMDLYPLAETWECSTHPDGLSVAANGMFEGISLDKILKQRPDFLGKRWSAGGMLPVLVKLIDADKDLSIQVHPDDAYARRNENGQSGKTELWYVLDACKDAQLVYGLHHDVSKETVQLKNIYRRFRFRKTMCFMWKRERSMRLGPESCWRRSSRIPI